MLLVDRYWSILVTRCSIRRAAQANFLYAEYGYLKARWLLHLSVSDLFGVNGLAMLTSTLGVGSLFGSLFLARRSGVTGLTRILIFNVPLLSLAVIGFGSTSIYVFALICTFFGGIAIVMIGVIEQTLLQSAVDNTMRGRILSFYTLIALGCPSIGALLAGALAEIIGLQAAVISGAVLCIGLWFWAFLKRDALAHHLEVKAG